MKNIQEVFNRIQQLKKEQKELKKIFKEALDSSIGYKDVVEELKALRTKKKQIETAIKEEFSSEMQKLEDLKIDIETETDMLRDIAVTQLMKGEQVQITDENNTKYEPVFSVKFQKT